ncbi:Por secretion system C-terminal sorting domain-containing protein [Fibrobacter sp. UWB15]|uniref:sialate O-acetylesterase n=1 Tax=unclassified Fibrobacter TaxID=2634177 RepID=UPI000910AAF7|nr:MULTISPECIES: sialate O-acetylesterase [unclassified Fibrobacter]PWJ68035.1 putative secreted protein (Por secretion system target) [Fibrobacter sp. UWB6]SHF85094.1 Por secretion system C-terminal sorting domain-containing protein [Fibrobacter sp. UWB8]SMG17636.1 Por secretion system C-terminal sorting domain-containing protein [Fibrobacter sp. UWB15]
MKKILLGAAFVMALSQVNAAPDPNFHIYLAFGQSNMEGQGAIEQQDKSVDDRFQVLWAADNGSCSGKTKGKWSTAVPPLAHCQGAKLGPTDYFGRTMVEKTDSQIKVGVIVVAVAGCSIKLFDKDQYRSYAQGQQSWMTQRINDYGGNPYGRLIEMAKKAQEEGVIKGIIFHQGETDAGDGNWPSAVKKVYDNIIKDLGLENDIPFLAGEVLRSGVSKGANNNIAKLPQQSKNFYVVSSEGFNQALGDGQNVHFTSQEYRDFGKRYAEKMIEVLGDKLKPAATAESSSSVAESSSSAAESSSSEVASSSSHSHHGVSSSSEAGTGIAQANHFAGGALTVNKAGNVQLSLAKATQLTVKIYSSLGKEVLDLSGNYAGTNTLVLANRLPAGRYVVSAQGEGFKATKPVMVK